MWPLTTAKRAIIVAGCLSMAYTQLITSPAMVQFARSLGGTDLHIGILGAVPVGLVFMQWFAALAVNRLPYRKPLWFWLSIVQRLIFLPAALGPWLWPQLSDAFWIGTLLVLTVVNHGLYQFAAPLWLSWMGDYLPHKGLNGYWGVRHALMQWTAALALLANSLFFFQSGIDVRAAFAAIIVLGCLLGVGDILLFIRIDEPRASHRSELKTWNLIAAPFRRPDFRSFILFSCFWNLAAMVGAPFISVFLLEYVGMDLYHVLLLWTLSWVGGALFSHQLGQWTERFGQRPMLVLCTALKWTCMLALLACPADPVTAFWVLTPVLMLDAFLNAGILIANNGFMIKNSPQENRTMFIAAGNGFAGLVGGVTSVLAGWVLAMTDSWSAEFHGLRIVNFHVAFAVSLLLRLAAVWLATFIREPQSAGARYVAGQVLAASRERLAWVWSGTPARDYPAQPAIVELLHSSSAELEPDSRQAA